MTTSCWMISEASIAKRVSLLPSIFLCFCASFIVACSDPAVDKNSGNGDKTVISGTAFGTTYQVQFPQSSFTGSVSDLDEGISKILDNINELMSSYQETSELSRFNKSRVNRWFPVSADTFSVLLLSQRISASTNGAFDVTVGSLVALWGFGEDGVKIKPPKKSEIREELYRVGFNHLQLDPHQQAILRTSELELNVSAIAKGYAVDKIKAYLFSKKHRHFMIEVGGEIFAAGKKAAGVPWKVAIEYPDPVSEKRVPFRVLQLGDAGVATSGNYRNFFDHEGRRYSHTIDSRTGEPVNHHLVSVSVVHKSLAMADAWATALTVLGPEAGLKMAEKHGLAALFIAFNPANNRFTESFTIRALPYMEVN